MPAAIDLVVEPPKHLTGREERALLQQAAGRRCTAAIRIRLAQLHNRLDEFGEAIALLGPAASSESFAEAQALAIAHLGRGHAGDPEAALAAARHAETLAVSDATRANARNVQAQALRASGFEADAAEASAAALDLDPANFEALRAMCGPWLRRGEAGRVLAACDMVAAKGAAHVQLLGLRTIALAQRGDLDAARALAGLDRFLLERVLPAPPGWRGLPAFHAALVRELLECPGIREGRHGTASIATLRIDDPARANTPAMCALQQLIVAHIREAIDALPGDTHPWLCQKPAAAQLRLWCVMTGSDGFERWHMHPAGWASGGYYVAVPESVTRGNSSAGCLEFGLPDRFADNALAAAFGPRLVRPKPGLLTLFPSHAYHRTHPHGAEGLRICVAFDLVPQ